MLFPIKIVYLFPSRTFAWGTWWKGMLACNFRLWFFFFIQSITTDSDKNNSSVQCLTWTWKSGSCRLFTAILPLALRFSWARDAFFSTQIIFCLFSNVCMFNYFLNPRKCLNKSFCTVLCEKVLPCAETGWLVSLILCPCTAGSSVIIPCFHGNLPLTRYHSLRFFLQFLLPKGEKWAWVCWAAAHTVAALNL